MPKEIVHWLIAEEAASLLKGTSLENAVAENPACLRFGAIFPDVLFYLVGNRYFRRIGRLADILHGTDGEDTYRLLRSLSETPGTSGESGPLTAFWIGVAAHLQADIVFHPLIYYLTGNYHDKRPEIRTLAIQRHRRLEVILDMYFTREKTSGQLRSYSLGRICNQLELPMPNLLKIASQTLAELSDSRPEEIAFGLRRALRYFVLMQNLCSRPFLGSILFRMEKLLPQPLREITALFQAPQLAAHFSFLSKPVIYRNPVSGKKMESTVDLLFAKAVHDSADLCKNLQQYIPDRNYSAVSQWGPSLSFGIPGSVAGDARYFASLSI
jgi:hypothetical protein